MKQSETKQCQNCKNKFTIEPEDFEFYEKIQVPFPTFCPDCRLVRRMLFKVESILYNSNCNLCNKKIVSIYHKDSPYTVYCQKCWWSDNWDAMDYGIDYDFNKSFFEQFHNLNLKTPKPNFNTTYSTMINSEYVNFSAYVKNSFLVFGADFIENSAYLYNVHKVKDSFDCDNTIDSELCYSSYNLKKCYKTSYSLDCKECFDVMFSKNLSNCSYCFGCINLKNKKYCIFNKEYSKEEYFNEINELFDGSYAKLKEIKDKLKNIGFDYPQKYFHGYSNVNSIGDYIEHCKNAKFTFLSNYVEDSKFISLATNSKGIKDCYDFTDWGDNIQRVYECTTIGEGAFNILFSHSVYDRVSDIKYSYYCINNSNLFGCVSLRNKQYCILNKQYTKEEYEKLVIKIIKHMG